MATADELLASEVCDNILTVDLDSRTIIIPKTVTNIGVESDDNVEVMHFQVPRYHCEVDLSEFRIRVNYLNAKGGGDVYDVTKVNAFTDRLEFDWVVGRNAVVYKGNVTFNLCFRDTGNNGEVLREFNTTIATLPVLPGLETSEAAIQEYTDILEQWRSELFGTGETVEQQIKDAGAEAVSNIAESVSAYVNEHPEELRGPRGYTFTPSVDASGNLSWTNDGGLVNPTTRSIKGPIGEKGDKGDTGEKGDKGDTGATGPKGDTGAAFTYDMFTPEQLAALTGPAGDDGASIDSIKRTSGTGAAGTTDTYTITMDDGRTSTFTVYNGADGEGAGDMLASVYDTKKRNTDIFDYVDGLIGDINTILDEINGE